MLLYTLNPESSLSSEDPGRLSQIITVLMRYRLIACHTTVGKAGTWPVQLRSFMFHNDGEYRDKWTCRLPNGIMLPVRWPTGEKKHIDFVFDRGEMGPK